MSYLILFFSLVFTIPSLAQQYFAVENRGDKEISFPLFASDANPNAARRINEFLGLTELQVIPEKHKNIFEVITKEDAMGGLYGRKVIVNHIIHSNSPKVLSLEIYNAADGMTMHYWTDFFTFDPQNGDRIDLEDLFTKIGWKQFKKLSHKKRVRAFRPIRKEWKFNGEEEIYHMYLEDDYESFYIEGDTIVHNGFNLFPKGTQTDLLTIFTFKEVASMLNSYGKAVLGPESDSVKYFRSLSRPQLMKGKVGDYPITCILAKGFFGTDYSEISGIYAYDKYGVGISLFGYPKKNVVTMEEMSEPGADTCEVTFKFTQTSLIGNWINKTKHKTLQFWAKKEE